MKLQDSVIAITGGGQGLGRAMAEYLAAKGARIALIDLMEDKLAEAAEACKKAGGDAKTYVCNVAKEEDVEATFQAIINDFGHLNGLVNNAGILRDKTFAKMELDDFTKVLDVHLIGSVNCTKAVWEIMRNQQYGRIVMTTSSSGLFGNFGQSNYGAAKLALVGFMQTLALEGGKYNIRVNSLAPTAATQMTEGLMPPEVLEKLKPETVSPGVVFLCSEDAPTRTILAAGAGSFETAHITLTKGVYIGDDEDAADQIAARFAEISDRTGDQVPGMGGAQGQQEITNLMAAHKKG